MKFATLQVDSTNIILHETDVSFRVCILFAFLCLFASNLFFCFIFLHSFLSKFLLLMLSCLRFSSVYCIFCISYLCLKKSLYINSRKIFHEKMFALNHQIVTNNDAV